MTGVWNDLLELRQRLSYMIENVPFKNEDETITGNWEFQGSLTWNTASGNSLLMEDGGGGIQMKDKLWWDSDQVTGSTYGDGQIQWEVWPFGAIGVGGTLQHFNINVGGNTWALTQDWSASPYATVVFGDNVADNLNFKVYGNMEVTKDLTYNTAGAAPSAPTAAGNKTYSEDVGGSDELHSVNYAGSRVQITSGTGLYSPGVNHSLVANLNADDHPQYAEIAEAETVTGLWDFTTPPTINSDTIALLSSNNDFTGLNTFENDIVIEHGSGARELRFEGDLFGSFPYDWAIRANAADGSLKISSSVSATDLFIGDATYQADIHHYGDYTAEAADTWDLSALTQISLPTVANAVTFSGATTHSAGIVTDNIEPAGTVTTFDGELDIIGELYVNGTTSIGTATNPYEKARLGIYLSGSATLDKGMFAVANSSSTASTVYAGYYQGRATYANTSAWGIFGYARANHAGTTTSLVGMQFNADFLSSATGGTVTNAYGSRINVAASRNPSYITNAYHIDLVQWGVAGGVVTNWRGIRINSISGHAVTNAWGIQIYDLTGATNCDAIRVDIQSSSGSASKGNIVMRGRGHDQGHIKLGDIHLWEDDGNTCLRGKDGAPTADDDGTRVMGNEAIFCYETTGGVTIPTTWTAIPWDAEGHKDINYTHSTTTNNSEITIDRAGRYEITADVTTDVSDTTRSHTDVKLQYNSGGGWTDIGGSLAYAYNRTSADGKDTASTRAIYVAAADDKIRVVAQSDRATQVTTVANASRLIIKEI